MGVDKAILDFVREYHVFCENTIWIAVLIASFVALSGCIRFGIAAYRRHKGIYPPAASQMEDH